MSASRILQKGAAVDELAQAIELIETAYLALYSELFEPENAEHVAGTIDRALERLRPVYAVVNDACAEGRL